MRDLLPRLAGEEPVRLRVVDLAPRDRLFTGQAWELIPHSRYLGNAVLSLLTKIASGYWHVADSQAGYTAIALPMLESLDLDRVYPRYGFPNDLLVHLNVWNARVRDVPSRPIYNVGETLGHPPPPRRAAHLLAAAKAFFWRMKEKYVIRDFHPLVFFYGLGMLLLFAGLGARDLGDRPAHPRQRDPDGNVVLIALLLIFGVQFTLFAMWFDMESNKDLR